MLGIICAGTYGDTIYDIRYEMGAKLAQESLILGYGGKSGVMEAACKDAKQAYEVTIGNLPGASCPRRIPGLTLPSLIVR